MKHPAAIKYGFILCLSAFLSATVRISAAQDRDSVQVTEFSTIAKSGDTIRPKETAKDAALSGFKNLDITLNWDSIGKVHSPRRAALYSAIFPGLGQIYNRQFIKVPFMWAGVGVATGVFIFNFDHYTTFRDAYRLALNGKPTGDPRIDVYSPQDLKYLRDGYRQYVDYSVLGFAAVYLYNILDAVVFGYLYNFDVASPLSKVRFGPVFHQDQSYVGFGFTYHF